MDTNDILELINKLDILKIVFSSNISDIKKAIIRKVNLKDNKDYQIEYFLDNKAYHINIEKDSLNEYILKYLFSFKQILIKTLTKSYTLALKSNKYKLKINDNNEDVTNLQHNKQKKYILNEGDDVAFLKELGIMSSNNLVKKKAYNKFRQINKYLEIISDTIDSININNNKINILDFGCGKSYLTFATYYYLKEFKPDLDFNIIGLDLKKDVIDNCNKIAMKLGFTKLVFLNEDIKDYNGEKVDLVFSLHACNNATDYSIEKALSLDAKAILAVPCCHNEFYKNIKLNESLSFLKKDKIVLEKFCSLLTESYRSAFLETCSYKVSLEEFIDEELTPKNILIKAIKTNNINRTKSKKNFDKIKDLIGFDPLLEKIANDFMKG